MSDALRLRAEEVRDEVKRGLNTAERVGSVLVGLVGELDEVAGDVTGETGLGKRVDELSEEVNQLREKLSEFMGLTYISAIEVPPGGGGAVIGVKTICEEWEVM